MKNLSSQQQKIINVFSLALLSLMLAVTMLVYSYLTKTANLFLNIECIAVTVLFIFGYNILSNQYYAEQNVRIKWRIVTLGLKKVDWNKYDFHLIPVLTFTRVNHPSGLATSSGLALEWGHWAISIGRFKFLKK